MKRLIQSRFSKLAVVCAVVLTGITMIFAQAPRTTDKLPAAAIENVQQTVDDIEVPGVLPTPPVPPRPPGGPMIRMGGGGFGAVGGGFGGGPPVPTGFMATANGQMSPMMPFPPGLLATAQSQEDREFEMKCHDLVSRIRETTAQADRKALIADLKVSVTEHFNSRQKHRDEELKQLEVQLKKLREIQEKREAARDEIIAERVQQLVRESDGLNWGGVQSGVQASGGQYMGAINPQSGIPQGLVGYQPAMAGGNKSGNAVNEFGTRNSTRTAAAEVPPTGMKVFKIPGVENSEDASQFLNTIEQLLGEGPQRGKLKVTTFGNKIVARGTSTSIKLVEEIISQLQDDVTKSLEEKGYRVKPQDEVQDGKKNSGDELPKAKSRPVKAEKTVE